MLFGCAASPRVAPGEARVLFTFRKLNLRNTIFSKKMLLSWLHVINNNAKRKKKEKQWVQWTKHVFHLHHAAWPAVTPTWAFAASLFLWRRLLSCGLEICCGLAHIFHKYTIPTTATAQRESTAQWQHAVRSLLLLQMADVGGLLSGTVNFEHVTVISVFSYAWLVLHF